MDEEEVSKSPADFKLPEDFESLVKTFHYCGADFFKKNYGLSQNGNTNTNPKKTTFKILDAMLYNAHRKGHKFLAACDLIPKNKKKDKKVTVGKAHGSYKSVEEFTRRVIETQNSGGGGIHLYEIVQNQKLCKLHIDVEYWIRADNKEDALQEGRQRIETICNNIADYTRVKYSTRPERFYVYESSRMDAKKHRWKNSFHITSPDVVFQSNTDAIKVFLRDFIELFVKDDSAVLIDPSNPGSVIIDMKIYTPNRLWRTMYSSKADDASGTKILPLFFIHPSEETLFEESEFVGSLANYYPEYDGDYKILVKPEPKRKTKQADAVPPKKKSKPNTDAESLANEGGSRSNRCIKKISILNIDQNKRLKVLEQVTTHVRCLDASRAEDYEKWTHVLFCLKNIGYTWACLTEMRNLFIEFSQTCANKFDMEAVSNKFDQHVPREGNSFSLNALKEWYLQDNPQAVGEELAMYDVMKYEFEKTYFKVLDLHSVVYVNDQKDIISITESALTYAYKNRYCYVRVNEDDPPSEDDDEEEEEADGKKRKRPKETTEILDIGTMKVKRVMFVRRWLKDEDMRTYRKLVCEPDPNKPVEPGCFNTWPGIKAESLEPINNPELIFELVQPIINHLCEVVTGEEHIRFLLLWIRQQIVQPSHKSMVALLLQGEQGAGKDIIFDFLREKVLGKSIACQTADPDVIWGRHSMALLNCVFLQYDEACGTDLKPFLNRIKDTVTAPVLNLNPKNAKPILGMPSFVNIVFTTNNYNPIPIETSDRRMVTFKCSSVYKGNHEHFQKLLNHLGQDIVARAMYEFLHSMKIRPEEELMIDNEVTVNFQNIRPKTEYFNELKSMNIPVFYKIISTMCNQQPYVVCTTNQFLDYCNDWVSKNSFSMKYSNSIIGKEVREFHRKYYDHVKREAYRSGEKKDFNDSDPKNVIEECGLLRRRCRNSSMYHFDWVKLRDVLKEFDMYDDDQ